MVDPLSFFLFQSVFHDWCNKGMCNPVCGMVHVKDPLLLVKKGSLCSGGSGFSHSLSEWYLPYVRRHITVLKCVECVIK